MKTLNKIIEWNNIQDYTWSDFFRFFLGSFLFYIGMNYQTNPQYINLLVMGSGLSDYASAVHYVPWINIIGGIMIAFGFQTKWAAAIQIPILAGAVVLYLIAAGGNDPIFYSELAVSILTLIMLVVYMIKGSGPYSIDGFLNPKDTVVHSNEYNRSSHF